MCLIRGDLVDEESRCVHWHSPLDVIAIKFKCCKTYYACYTCHQSLESHKVEKYSLKEDNNEHLVICGVCKTTMTFDTYRSNSGDERSLSCYACHAEFNPGCKLHYSEYFDM
ncbi:LAFE_0C13036g1_1 [Lachancea fermentati]|uniref:LAFE_0C13036g1_1 n=1 Tax=Lachancea fermentati TaxID=4955 RepID=A0A1G4MAN9_LACFM|nr:LAFE_0C13036g1_1 [Lachancea fermentati]